MDRFLFFDDMPHVVMANLFFLLISQKIRPEHIIANCGLTCTGHIVI